MDFHARKNNALNTTLGLFTGGNCDLVVLFLAVVDMTVKAHQHAGRVLVQAMKDIVLKRRFSCI